MYRKVLERFGPSPGDTQVHLYLGRAMYDMGSSKQYTKSDRLQAFDDCIAVMQKAVHLNPSEPVLQ